jgi:predicted PurR-regulated permease PerM
MEYSQTSDEVKLAILIIAIFIVTIIAFWSLMTVFVWAVAIASALLPAHKRLCRIVKPSVSATFITVWVLLLILVVMVLAAGILIDNEEHIGDMALSMVTGLKNTGLSGFLPSFSEAQLSDFDETLKDLMVKVILTLTGNIM